MFMCFFFFQAEDGIRDLVRSRGLGDVYKRQVRGGAGVLFVGHHARWLFHSLFESRSGGGGAVFPLSLIHI